MPTRHKSPPAPSRPPRAPADPRDGSADAKDATRRRGASEPEEVSLRLAIGRTGVGIELAEPIALGCLRVTELTATLPGMRFPLDVTGGVPKFRHRRGVLQTVQLELGGRALEKWAAPRLRGVVGPRAPEVWVALRSAGATISVAAVGDAAEGGAPRGAPLVAFDVDALAEAHRLVLVVRRARGTDLPAPATAIAVGCVEAMLRGLAKRTGAVFVVEGGPGAIARWMMPQAGARAPSDDGLGWTSIGAHADTWIFYAMRGALTAPPSEDALRAREIAAVLETADDALLAGDLDAARELCVDALDRAPRHAEVARRLVQIDAAVPGRAEAALAMLAEAAQGDADPHFGTTPGELLAEVGDVDAALASLERAGDTEPVAALAARAFEIAARSTKDVEDAARWLDRALARAPRSVSARWLRVERRLELGRLEDALADVEHLDALARGGRAKYKVWLAAGHAWRAAGLGAYAGELFERALRHAPDDATALAGLGAALVGEGRKARGVAVLARAVQMQEEAGASPASAAPMVIDLARALAEELDDLPAAIARVGGVPAEAAESMAARGLEGRWRAAVGDAAGAALAFARLRELASSLATASEEKRGRGVWVEDPRLAKVTAFLAEAAAFQRGRMHDVLGAQRHLAVALRLRPHDAELRRSYRDIGALLAHPDRQDVAEESAPVAHADGFADDEAGSAVHTLARGDSDDSPVSRGPTPIDLGLSEDIAASDEDVRAMARVEELTRRLHADPADDDVADELGGLLEQLGRGHELLALVTARLEDATPERKVHLAPKARAVLERLATQADAAGRSEEAALYRAAAEALPS